MCFWGGLVIDFISSDGIKKKKTFLVPIFFKLHYISRNGGMRVCILFGDYHYYSTRVMGLDQIKHYVVNVLHDYLGLLWLIFFMSYQIFRNDGSGIYIYTVVTLRSSGTDILYGCHLLRCLYNILISCDYDEFFIILYNILKIAELDCCQIIILSIYVPSTHA